MFFCTIVSIRVPEALKRIALGVSMCGWKRESGIKSFLTLQSFDGDNNNERAFNDAENKLQGVVEKCQVALAEQESQWERGHPDTVIVM